MKLSIDLIIIMVEEHPSGDNFELSVSTFT